MHKLRAIAIAVALGAMAFPALAQETTVIGRGSNRPSVTVDLSVLDDLGPTPTARPQSKLKAPGANGSGKSKKQTVSKSGKKPQTKTAATSSAPPAPPQNASVAPAQPPLAELPSPMPPPIVTEAQPSAPPPPRPSIAPSALAPPAAPPLPPAPMPAPQAAASATAAPAPQLAALPPPGASVGAGKTVQLGFGESASQLDDKAKRDLDVLVRSVGSDEETRLQLTAYASAPGADNASQARRLSLSRALAVRSYLIEKGVKSTRIDVRALGNKNEGGPADRVDVLVARR
jgi:outer membrane protein OmpA-like peptidoglycan-associated protein